MYKVIKHRRNKPYGTWSVELLREDDNRHFWVDVAIDEAYFEVEADWNQWIFNLEDNEDLVRKDIQDNSDEFDLATSEAICYLEKEHELEQDQSGLWFTTPSKSEWLLNY